MTVGCDVSSEIALRWTSLDLGDDKSTLVQVMAWCRQATSHYLHQCWPRSLASYGITRPQWVNMYYIDNSINPIIMFHLGKHFSKTGFFLSVKYDDEISRIKFFKDGYHNSAITNDSPLLTHLGLAIKAFMHQSAGSSLVKVKAFHLFRGKPLSKPMLACCHFGSQEQIW